MSDPKVLILEAGEKHSNVETAKLGVEAAKAQLEEAKQLLENAKSLYDQHLQACEEAGLTKAKVKKAAELIGSAFAEAGIIEAPQDGGEQPIAQKAASKRGRRKKAQAAPDPETKTAAAAADAGPKSDAVETPTAEDAAKEGPEDVTGEAIPTGAKEYDYSDEVTELNSLIEDIIHHGRSDKRKDDAARLLLKEVVIDLVDQARTSDENVDASSYARMLTDEYGRRRAKGFNLTEDEGIRVIAWARDALQKVEENAGAGIEPIFASSVASEPEKAPVSEEVSDHADAESKEVEPELAPPSPAEEVTDDSSFPMEEDEISDDDGNYYTSVDGVDEINLFDGEEEADPEDEPAAGAEKSEPAAEPPAPAPKAAFAPPSFLNKKK